jgi:hypothetical protein
LEGEGAQIAKERRRVSGIRKPRLLPANQNRQRFMISDNQSRIPEYGGKYLLPLYDSPAHSLALNNEFLLYRERTL